MQGAPAERISNLQPLRIVPALSRLGAEPPEIAARALSDGKTLALIEDYLVCENYYEATRNLGIVLRQGLEKRTPWPLSSSMVPTSAPDWLGAALIEFTYVRGADLVEQAFDAAGYNEIPGANITLTHLPGGSAIAAFEQIDQILEYFEDLDSTYDVLADPAAAVALVILPEEGSAHRELALRTRVRSDLAAYADILNARAKWHRRDIVFADPFDPDQTIG